MSLGSAGTSSPLPKKDLCPAATAARLCPAMAARAIGSAAFTLSIVVAAGAV